MIVFLVHFMNQKCGRVISFWYHKLYKRYAVICYFEWFHWKFYSRQTIYQYLKSDSHQWPTTVKAIIFHLKNLNAVINIRKILKTIRNYCNSKWKEVHTRRGLATSKAPHFSAMTLIQKAFTTTQISITIFLRVSC